MKTQNKGITLITLVIAIVILLILAGISIASLVGENGLLTKARTSREKYEKATYQETINLVLIDENLNRMDKDISTDEFLKNVKEELEKDKIFDGSEMKIEQEDDKEKLIIKTKEDYIFVIEDGETGNGSESKELIEIEEIVESDIVIRNTPSEWTNKNVEVEIENMKENKDEYIIQYSFDQDKWITYSEKFVIEKNTEIYVRLKKGEAQTKNNLKYKIDNIDRGEPNPPTITPSGTMGNNDWYASNITLSITPGEDKPDNDTGTISGIDRVTYVLTGDTSKEETTFDGVSIINEGTTTITAYTYDKAGNKSEPSVLTVKKDQNHNFGEYVITKNATCVVEGTKERTCKICNKKESANIAVLGHNSTTGGSIQTSATCTVPERRYHKCSRCGVQLSSTYQSTNALGHNPTTGGSKASNVSCTTPDSYYHKCSRCGVQLASTYITQNAWGHIRVQAMSLWDGVSSDYSHCSKCAYTFIGRDYVCKRCGRCDSCM